MENNTFKITLGLNLGNYFNKIVGDMGKDIFKASAKRATAKDFVDVEQVLKTDPDVIEINGRLYEIGTTESIPAHIRERDLELLQTIIAYSVARHTKLKKGLGKYKEFNVKMAVGLPLTEYIEKSNRVYVLNNFANNFKVRYLGKEFTINIQKNDISVLGEGYCHYQVNYNKYKDVENLFLVDIGSRTIDTCNIIDGKPRNPRTRANGGTLSLLEELRKATGREDLSEKKVEMLLRKGTTKIKGTVLKLTDYKDVVDAYVSKVIAYLKKTYADIINADKIVFFGGGAYLFTEYLLTDGKSNGKYFDAGIEVEILENAEYVNAESYYLYALNA